jgi:hypothetical protein
MWDRSNHLVYRFGHHELHFHTVLHFVWFGAKQNHEAGEHTSQSRDHLEREVRKLDGLLSVFRT